MEWYQYLITIITTLIFTFVGWLVGNFIRNKK